MDLVEIFEVIFGAGFIILALIGSRQIFGGIFYSKKVKAVAGKRESKIYANIGGVKYTDGRRVLCMMRICIYMKFVKNVP